MTSPASDDDDDDPWFEGPIVTTKEDEKDRNYVGVGSGTIDGDGPKLDTDALFDEGELRVTAFDVEADGSVVDGHLYWETDTADEEKVIKTEWDTVVIKNKPPMMATVGSPCLHGNPLFPGIGSANVYAMGQPVWRMFVDQHVCTAATPNPHGPGLVLPMGPPPRVYVNGFPCARAGDAVAEPLGGPNPIMYGASKVWAGTPAPPVRSINPIPRITVEEDPWYTQARKWVFDVDVEANAGLDVELLKQKDKISGGGMIDPDDAAWGPNVRFDTDGELIHAKAKAYAKVKGKFFGMEWDWTPIDWKDEGGAGKWNGYAEVYLDPATKKPGVRGEFEFGEPEDD
ncbi:MAG: hypothetical protein AAF721_04350 [Myxococcota bacterium]